MARHQCEWYIGRQRIRYAAKVVRHLNAIEKGNEHDSRIKARVVEGVDVDGDGRVDAVEFRE